MPLLFFIFHLILIDNLYIPKIFYSTTGDEDEIDQLPTLKPFSFYTYDGSLTMPPCTEDTIHYVVSEPIPIASVVLELAREALRMPDVQESNKETGEVKTTQDIEDVENYRNIQDIRNRAVFYFDHERYCGATQTAVKHSKQKGHYERIKRKIQDYVYVPGLEPSHIPGSYVVSEKEAKGLESSVVDLTGN